jgi:dihydrofolate reductase
VRKISAILNISMDGVIQAPGRPDEDTRGGFDRGGWAVPYNDEVMAQRMGEGMSSSGAMLFGRRTYQDFYGYWPRQTDNPFTPYLNQVTKYRLRHPRRAAAMGELDPACGRRRLALLSSSPSRAPTWASLAVGS